MLIEIIRHYKKYNVQFYINGKQLPLERKLKHREIKKRIPQWSHG